MIICHTVPEIQPVADVIFVFHFGLFFALLRFLALEKNGWKFHHFTQMGTKIMIRLL